jgi:hypothetical protein
MGCFWPGLYLFGPGPLGFHLYTSPPLPLLSPHSQLQPSATELAARASAELLHLTDSLPPPSLPVPIQAARCCLLLACCFLLPLPCCCLLPPPPSAARAPTLFPTWRLQVQGSTKMSSSSEGESLNRLCSVISVISSPLHYAQILMLCFFGSLLNLSR